jgi:hypothetical protein
VLAAGPSDALFVNADCRDDSWLEAALSDAQSMATCITRRCVGVKTARSRVQIVFLFFLSFFSPFFSNSAKTARVSLQLGDAASG